MVILITGITGFLGSSLAERFTEAGHFVVGVRRSESRDENISVKASAEIFLDNGGLISSNHRDLLSRIDCVIHTAAIFQKKNQSPCEYIESNILFPLKILELISSSNAYSKKK
jgi:CDP-paratose synthetase